MLSALTAASETVAPNDVNKWTVSSTKMFFNWKKNILSQSLYSLAYFFLHFQVQNFLGDTYKKKHEQNVKNVCMW